MIDVFLKNDGKTVESLSLKLVFVGAQLTFVLGAIAQGIGTFISSYSNIVGVWSVLLFATLFVRLDAESIPAKKGDVSQTKSSYVDEMHSSRFGNAWEHNIDQICQTYLRSGVAGLNVLISKGGKICFVGNYGNSSVETSIVPDTDTIFLIGSITKQFTSVAILKLIEEGYLSLDDRLNRFVPDFHRGDEISIQHLLTHTSGISRQPAGLMSRFDRDEDIGVLAFIESFKHDALLFSPGEDWMYSNCGYYLLGHIVEQVSGLSYEDYITTHLLNPFSLDRSGVFDPTFDYENIANGYTLFGDTVVDSEGVSSTQSFSAGAMFSTLNDLFTWNEALFGGRLLKRETMEKAFEPVKFESGEGSTGSYGFGFIVRETDFGTRIGHGGAYPGFISYISRFTEHDVNVIVLSNTFPISNRQEFNRFYRRLSNEFLKKYNVD